MLSDEVNENRWNHPSSKESTNRTNLLLWSLSRLCDDTSHQRCKSKLEQKNVRRISVFSKMPICGYKISSPLIESLLLNLSFISAVAIESLGINLLCLSHSGLGNA